MNSNPAADNRNDRDNRSRGILARLLRWLARGAQKEPLCQG